jgi:GntR family transcriptional regulator, sialic acid-inducible nan operon repressor
MSEVAFSKTGKSYMTSSDPIPRVKIYQEIAKRIEAQILDGRLRAGNSLPSERELMAVYQVGRPAVREALMSLQRSGLIAVSTGERARVVRPSASKLVGELGTAVRYALGADEGVREFQQARRLFEIALARHAALHATSEDLSRIKEALNSNETAFHALEGAQSDISRFVQTDVEFHFRIAQVAGNSIFSALHAAMVGWLTEQRITSSEVPGAPQSAVKWHRAIFRAISAGDAEAAEKAMQKHLAEVEADYWKARKQWPSRS